MASTAQQPRAPAMGEEVGVGTAGLLQGVGEPVAVPLAVGEDAVPGRLADRREEAVLEFLERPAHRELTLNDFVPRALARAFVHQIFRRFLSTTPAPAFASPSPLVRLAITASHAPPREGTGRGTAGWGRRRSVCWSACAAPTSRPPGSASSSSTRPALPRGPPPEVGRTGRRRPGARRLHRPGAEAPGVSLRPRQALPRLAVDRHPQLLPRTATPPGAARPAGGRGPSRRGGAVQFREGSGQ